MRYSKQKDEILNTVLESNCHPDANYIYNLVKLKIPNISLGTVYRNLNILANEGKIRKILLEDGNYRFDKTLKVHNHIRCINCNKLVDIDTLINSDEIKKIEENTYFKVTNSCFNLNGICSDCKGKEK